MASATHSCAIAADGAVYCWGGNEHGQLGQGDTSPRDLPARVALAEPIAHVDGLNATVLAVAASGAGYGWGWDAENEFGQAEPVNYDNRETLPIPLLAGQSLRWAAAGQGHSLLVEAGSGALFVAGRNSQDQLGLGPSGPVQQTTFVEVGPVRWRAVEGGQSHSCGIATDGTLWCWGENGSGQLGTGDMDLRDVPFQVDARSDWLAVDVNTFHGCALRGAGELYCWGRNVEGQLGLGDTAPRLVPTRVGAAADWRFVGTGRFHTCAQNRAGEVFCAGENGDGRLGDGTTQRRDELTRALLP